MPNKINLEQSLTGTCPEGYVMDKETGTCYQKETEVEFDNTKLEASQNKAGATLVLERGSADFACDEFLHSNHRNLKKWKQCIIDYYDLKSIKDTEMPEAEIKNEVLSTGFSLGVGGIGHFKSSDDATVSNRHQIYMAQHLSVSLPIIKRTLGFETTFDLLLGPRKLGLAVNPSLWIGENDKGGFKAGLNMGPRFQAEELLQRGAELIPDFDTRF